MNCLTSEQLVALNLGMPNDTRAAQHIAECASCRSDSAAIAQWTHQLHAEHAKFDHRHARARSSLLARLQQSPNTTTFPARPWHRLINVARGLSLRQRVAAAGVGLSTIAATVVLMVLFANLASPLSAMDRMAHQLRRVHSYSYRLYTTNTFVKDGETTPTTVTHTGTTAWQAPDSLRYDERIERTAGPQLSGEQESGLLASFTGIHPTGQLGLMIYHAGRVPSKIKTYYSVPSVNTDEVGDQSPITRLRMAREGEGKVLSDLGTRQINGVQARGYVMSLANAEPGSGFDSLQVWVDPATDLPLEISCKVTSPDSVREFRVTDCRWNVEFDPQLFDTTPPAGYTEIEPPK